MEIKIERGIKLPATQQTGITATLRKMKAGDSFVVDERGSIQTCARSAGIKIATRKEGDKIRIWRIE